MKSESPYALNNCFEDNGKAATGWRELVHSLTPAVRAGVLRALSRRRGQSGGRNILQDVEELTQEIFVGLLDQDGRRLRTWNPHRGLSLRSFVRLLAERETASRLRSARKSPWTEAPSEWESLDTSDGGAFERRMDASQLLRALLARIRQQTSPLGRVLFEELWIRNKTVPQICRQLKMSADAVYAWRCRLSKLARRLYGELLACPIQSESPSGAGENIFSAHNFRNL